MAGQIIPRGKETWLVKIFQGRDANGKRRYFSHTIHGKKKDADKYLRDKLRDKDLGVSLEPASESLDLFLDTWLSSTVKPRVRQRTFDDYTALMVRYVREPLGALKLSDVRALDIQRLYKTMQDDRELSPRVVRYVHAVLNSAFKQAVKWDMLQRNPCALVELPRMERKEMKAMTPDEVKALLSVIAGTRANALFMFALTTGMRPQEYLALKWSDLEMDKGTATVRRALVWPQKKGNDGWYFDEPKTSRARRTIPLPASMVKALADHKRKQGADRLKAGSEWQDHGLVFTSSLGEPLSIPALTKKWFKPALTKAELSTAFRLYDLRHTHATLLLANGENPKVAAERLGHSTIVLTLDTYSHVLPDMQQQAAERIETLRFASRA
jgi:integrase